MPNKNYTFKFNNLSKYTNSIHLVTKKDITQPYNFSLAFHTGENPKDILKNRRKIEKILNNKRFIVANQTHSDNIKIIKGEKERGWRDISTTIEDCDALITDQKGLMLTVLTADCVPILLFDPKKEVVSAVHAGWKGTKKGIAYKTVKKMIELFGCHPKNIVVGVAPSIGRCCYQVDREVSQYFVNYENSFDIDGDKYRLDLPYVNRKQLLNAKIPIENIELSGICTSCNVEEYFSYREEKGCSGRFMSMIGLK